MGKKERASIEVGSWPAPWSASLNACAPGDRGYTASVTLSLTHAMRSPGNTFCRCGTLENASKEPGHPIRWDERMHEYYIAEGGGGRMMIHYCPFCGGKTPESQRDIFFAHVTQAEEHRICSNQRLAKKRAGSLPCWIKDWPSLNQSGNCRSM